MPPTFDSPVYAGQVAEPLRGVSAAQFRSKQRQYSVGPHTFDAAQDDFVNVIKVPARTLFIASAALVYHTALGASAALQVGWAANPAIGLTADVDGLAAALDVAAAGSKNPFTLKNTALLAMSPLWAWCGLAADPGDGAEITITGQLTGANPAAGTLTWFLPIRDLG